MVLDAVSNFVRGRADAQLTAGATTLSVGDASIFPDPEEEGEYNLVIWDANNFPRPDQDGDVEIVRVTARDTGADELTVVRAQETTSDVAHSEGSAVHLSPTAKMFSDIEAEYTAQGENFDGQGTSEFSNLQSLSADQAGRGNGALWDAGSSWANSGFGLVADPDDTSSTTFTTIGEFAGAFSFSGRIPEGASLYGNLLVACSSISDGETGTYRTRIIEHQGDDISATVISELDVDVTEDGQEAQSGWVEITSISSGAVGINAEELRAKTTGGTLTQRGRPAYALLLEWRVD